MSDLLVLIAILIAGFAIRLPFATLASNDSWVVAHHLEHLRTCKRLDYKLQNCVFPAHDGYPILLHFLLSRLDRKWWKPIGLILNLSFDIIAALLVYWFALMAGATSEIGGLNGPVAAAVIFLTMPVLFTSTSRLRTVNSRTASLPLALCYFILVNQLLTPGASAPLLTFGIMVGAAGIVIVMIALSQFGLQVIVLFSAFLAVWEMDALPLLPPVAGFAIAAIPYFGLRPVLQHHWHFKVWYARNYRKGTSASDRNTASAFQKAVQNRTLEGWLQYLLRQNTVTIALIGVPDIILVLVSTDWRDIFNMDGLPYFATGIVCASVLSFTIVSIPSMSFLGQAERYFEYSSAFVSILLVSTPGLLGDTAFWLLLMLHAVGIVMFSLAGKGYLLTEGFSDVTISLSELTRWFQENAPEARILTVPVKLAYLLSALTYRGYLPCSVKLYFRLSLRDGDRGYSYFENDMASPYGNANEAVIGREVNEMAQEYGLTHVVFDRRYESLFDARSSYLKLLNSRRSVAFSNDEYVVLSLGPT